MLANFHGVNSPTRDDFKTCQHEVTDCGGLGGDLHEQIAVLVYEGGHCWEQACSSWEGNVLPSLQRRMGTWVMDFMIKQNRHHRNFLVLGYFSSLVVI